MKFYQPHAHDKPFTFLFLDVHNKDKSLNQYTLNQNFESKQRQGARHYSIQDLEVKGSEDDDGNKKTPWKRSTIFCAQSAKQNNIGKIVTNSFSLCDKEQAIRSMLDQEKFHILKNHAETTKNYSFPTPYNGGCYQSVGWEWVNMFPWLVCSGTTERVFCKLCSLFAKSRNNLGVVVNTPFIMLHKKFEYLSMYARNQYHIDDV